MSRFSKILTLTAAAAILCAVASVADAQTFKRKLTKAEDFVDITLKKGETYTITMSADYDTTIKLLGPIGLIAATDTGSGPNGEAQVVYTAKEGGLHTVVATSPGYKGRGQYTLNVVKGRPKKAAPAPLKKLFRDLDYDKALKVAAKEKKLVMLDFTTSWCGWCKKLNKDTFSKNNVQTLLNKRAISIKVDGDKEKALVRKNSVRGYPTLVFVDHKGEEVGRIVGYRNPTQFIGAARSAMKDSK